MKLLLAAAGVSGLLAAALWAQNKADSGFVSIFDGSTLKGWHVSAQTGHSRASKNESGGKWVVEQGAVLGSQDIPGNGGIIITDEQYGDFEVVLEMNNDFGPDSGLFLRSTENGKAWQAMIDYHEGGNLMGVYGEGLGGKPSVRNYTFLESPEKIVAVTNAPVSLPIAGGVEKLLAAWSVERITGANRRKSASHYDLDQRRENHGMD